MAEIQWSDPTYFTDKHALSMTLRDYFAAMAMQGFAAYAGARSDPRGAPECAYAWADAMLAAREG